MQQTDKYKLNLIETSDTFSPDALNENMEKVEGAITTEAAVLEQRITALEAHRILVGTYTGTGTVGPVDIMLDFTPQAVFLLQGEFVYACMTGGDYISQRDGTRLCSIIPNGFQVRGSPLGDSLNFKMPYYFLAIA